MYKRQVKRFFLDETNDFAPTDALVDAVDESVDMVFLCQPNNPTGQLASPEPVSYTHLIHEFHHWDSTANGTALAAKKPVGGAEWRCGFIDEHFYAGFPHLYWAGTPLPQRFAAAAENYRRDHD